MHKHSFLFQQLAYSSEIHIPRGVLDELLESHSR
jgi:hypothetical protein